MSLELDKIDLSGGSLPKGAKEGQFCAYHFATKENPEGTDCFAHIDEAVGIFPCRFTSIEEAMRVKDGGLTCADGVCRDAALRGHGADSEWSAPDDYHKKFEIRAGVCGEEGVIGISPAYLHPGLDTLEAIAKKAKILRAARKNAGETNESYEVRVNTNDPGTIQDLARTVFSVMSRNLSIFVELDGEFYDLSTSEMSDLFHHTQPSKAEEN